MVEFCTPVSTPGITKAKENQIERVQKAAYAIILSTKYIIYAKALAYLKRTTLRERKADLNLRFAKKCLQDEKYQHWFCLNKPIQQL